ncbi:hypothetical protein HPG69_001561 [Diceros bicornis minor]|uniref:Uncharacterized protein n=1 Tax=Diceros bicornis minor TaxID=77932 RepID=A0A7J7FFZ1_DICBM|nr:hypothetical protein HPG69_001561 [Diceros bicornis minor]
MKSQEIAKQKRYEKEMQQEMTRWKSKPRNPRSSMPSCKVKAKTQNQHDEYVHMWQDLEQAPNEQTWEFKLKHLIIKNFIPPEENKIMNQVFLDFNEKSKFQPLLPANNSQLKKQPMSSVGYKRPISQYAWVAMAMGSHLRHRAENIMFL